MKKFRNNGHAGGELELTMMRGWVKYGLVSDLVSRIALHIVRLKMLTRPQLLHLENIEEPEESDFKIYRELKSYLGRGPKGSRRRGNMLTLLAALDGDTEARRALLVHRCG